jgi:pilus assembly protein CpaC
MGSRCRRGIQFARSALITNQPLPRLDLASNGGFARMLRQATLITANGTEARYRNGGEFNARIVGATAARRWRASSTARRSRSRRASTRRAPASTSGWTATSPTSRSRAPTSPAATSRSSRRWSTSSSASRSSCRASARAGRPTPPRACPGLRQIPILGYLFGSEQNIEQEVEGMIFIVPTVVEGISRSAQDRVAEALRQYEQFSGDMDDVRLYDPTGAQYR